MISLDLTKSSEVRKAGDWPKCVQAFYKDWRHLEKYATDSCRNIIVLNKVNFFYKKPAPKIETVKLLSPFTIPNCATYLPEASQNWQSD